MNIHRHPNIVWQGKPHVQHLITAMIFPVVFGTIGFLAACAMMYCAISNGINFGSMIICFFITLYATYYFYKILKTIFIASFIRYEINGDGIRIYHVVLKNVGVSIPWYDVERLIWAHKEGGGGSIVIIKTSHDLGILQYDFDEFSMSPAPQFQYIQDGDALFERLDKEDFVRVFKKTPPAKPVKYEPNKKESYYFSILSKVYIGLFIFFNLFAIDHIALPQVIKQDTMKFEKSKFRVPEELISYQETLGGYRIHSYRRVAGPGQSVDVHVSPIFRSVTDVHNQSGSRKSLLKTGMRGLTGLCVFASILVLFYSIHRLDKKPKYAFIHEVGLVFLAPWICIIASLICYFLYN